MVNPGVTAPLETSGDGTPQPYGPNNEQLPKKLQSALLQLVRMKTREPLRARIEQIRMAREQRLFFKNHQYLWWDERINDFRLPTEAGGSFDTDNTADQPHYEYVTNLFQAIGLTIIAALSQDIPEVKVLPVSTQNEQDISTAEYADDVMDMIARNNCTHSKLQDQAHILWCDSLCAAHVRFVVDGQRFGYHEENEYSLIDSKLPDTFQCAKCGMSTPAETQPTSCPNCSAPLNLDNFREGAAMQVPTVTGVKKVPNGQEVISYHGVMEIATPIWANSLSEMPYLKWELEVDKAKLRAMYPYVADQISAGLTILGDDDFARIARMQVLHGGTLTQSGDALYNLVTFNRVWLRPWTFFELEDKELRDQFLKLFPEGCYVAFAGDTYCESRNESMDSCWRLMYPMPGEGQARTSMGSGLVDIQKRYNDLSNLTQETYEYQIPPMFADSEVIDFDAINANRAEPGQLIPAKTKNGVPIAQSFFQGPPASISGDMAAYMQDLFGPIAQMITGAMPSLFGGNMEDQQTARAYDQAHLAALGRMGIPWARIVEFHSEVMVLALQCAAKNRTQDIEIVEQNDQTQFASKVIPIDKLQGNVRIHYDEDSAMPKQWGQERATLMMLLNSPIGQTPEFLSALAHPVNFPWLKGILGFKQFVLPQEDARKKEMQEIAMLLDGAPIPPALNPQTGQMMPPQPSVPVDEMLDDHQTALATDKDWANSAEGIRARASKPIGWENFKLHAAQHQQYLQAQQQQNKPPSTSIALKDLPPQGQTQLAAQAGINIAPQEVLDTQFRDTISHHLPTLMKPPEPKGKDAKQRVQ